MEVRDNQNFKPFLFHSLVGKSQEWHFGPVCALNQDPDNDNVAISTSLQGYIRPEYSPALTYLQTPQTD